MLSWSPLLNPQQGHNRIHPSGTLSYMPFTELGPSRPVHGHADWVNTRAQLGNQADKDIVQFAAPIYFASEEDGKVEVDVMRLGSLKGRICVSFETEDGSAHANVKYKQASGVLVFDDGEHDKTITVDLIDDESWSPTLEFKVHLTQPENCDLGTNLYTARVKIIDDDCFPSNTYRDRIGPGTDVDEGLEGISPDGLFWNYIKWNWKAPGIAWRSVIYMTMDQLHNAYLYFKMWATIFIVDTLFNDDTPTSQLFMRSRSATAVLLALGYVVPMILLHIWDNWKTKLDVGGTTCALLAQSLFRKYLNYSEDSRLAVNHCDIHISIMDDCKTAADGYKTLLDMVRTITKFIILMSFVLSESPRALVYVVSMPLLMMFFSATCTLGLSEAEEVLGQREASIVAFIQEVCLKYRLIADFAQRPKMNEFFEHKVNLLRDAKTREKIIAQNLNMIPVWIGTLFKGLYIAMNAQYVPRSLQVGVFVATIGIIGDVADDFTELYAKMTSMKRTHDALFTLTRLFNLPTDLKLWQEVSSSRMDRTLTLRSGVFKTIPSNLPEDNGQVQFKTDLIPLEVSKMAYEYPDSDEGWVLRDVNISVKQGKLVAVVGPHGCGKATLLKLLGQCIFPSTGTIFMPTHLRILHVTQEPILLDVSALQNLTFGGANARDSNPDRIRKIMKKLEMGFLENLVEQDLMRWEQKQARENSAASAALTTSSDGEFDGEDEDELDDGSSITTALTHRSVNDGFVTDPLRETDGTTPWYSKLTHTEMVKVHLARALIMNPEVIVCHRPFSHFSVEKGKIMLSALKEHVDNRGLMLPIENRRRRRPRTAFYIPESVAQAEVADVVWQLDPAGSGLGGSVVYETTADKLSMDFQPHGK